MPKRKICVVTGSRAEYSLLQGLMESIRNDERTELQVVATGAHLSCEFGLTYREIEANGFRIDAKVDMMLTDDSAVGIAKSVGRGVSGFADVLRNLRPDMLVVLGDRFEILAAAQAAMFARIPIAHIHGGELTEGAIDDAIRHALTKISHLHFTAAEPYQRRVLQMGEDPSHVFNVGAPGLDRLKRVKLLEREELEAAIGIRLARPTFLVTYHPETLGCRNTEAIDALFEALDAFPQSCLIFTGSNADSGGRAISEAVMRYVAERRDRAIFRASLGQRLYLAALANADVVIGNSSSGLIEAPAEGVPTVNIGDRQKGRLRSASVIDCEPTSAEIAAAIKRAIGDEFRLRAKSAAPAYGTGNTAEQISEVLASFPLDRLSRKTFHDIP
jgi:UDP-N-acetylglucosamine 2-epimerase (non-hydrolysing)/GDP/UDP-N,N'-diacetylbacillosamine 2-epimerase (hydrolysing)